MAMITWNAAMIIAGVNGPPNNRWSSIPVKTIAPVVANVFKIESPYLMDKATSNPPAAPNVDKKKARNDQPPKNPAVPPPFPAMNRMYTGTDPNAN